MTKKKENRSNKILNLVTENQRIEVKQLSELLHVSQVTVRKDLDDLESKGLIKRIHGFAEMNNTDDISGRLAYHYNEKKSIAEKALDLIHDGDTIMIESGSCCAILASMIAANKKDVTIVTNSAFIAEYIREFNNITSVLLGGIYQRDSQCLVGPMIKEAAMNYNVNYFFLGTDGWSKKTGFTNKDQLRAQAVRDMSGSCDTAVILTESTKFTTVGTVPLNIKNKNMILITDPNITKATVREMKKESIEVLK